MKLEKELSAVNLFNQQIPKSLAWDVYRISECGIWWSVFGIVKALTWMESGWRLSLF